MVMTDDDLVERFEYNRMRTIADGQHSKYLRAAAELYQLRNERTAMLDVIEAGMQAVTSSQVDGLDSFTRRMDDLDSALVRARDLIGDNRE